MIFSLVYTVFAIALSAFLIKKIRHIPVETVEKPNGKTRKKYKLRHIIAAILAGVITAYLLILIPIVFLDDMLIEDYWLFFGKKRTAYIESRFSMTVDDDIKLKKYTVTGGIDGVVSRLEFECEMNGWEFFESKFDGTVWQYSEDGVLYTLNSETGEFESSGYESPDSENYWFRTSEGKSINAAFTPKDDGSGYIVKLH